MAPPVGRKGARAGQPGLGAFEVDAAIGQPRHRVDRRAVLADLEVQVDTGAVAGGSLEADQRPGAEVLARGDRVSGEVPVAGGCPAAVVEFDEVAVAGQGQAAVVIAVGAGAGGGDDGAAGGGVDGTVAGTGDVDPGVQGAPAGPVARGDRAGGGPEPRS